MTDLGGYLKIGTGIIAIIAAMFAVDARYQHGVEASEQFQQSAEDRERGDLETQLRVAKLELKHAKDADEKEYLKAKIAILERRLLELRN